MPPKRHLRHGEVVALHERSFECTQPLRRHPPGAGKEPRRLSVSERKVAEQVAAGCTNAQAAAALFLSKRTVDTHLRNIYRRLGISNRSELTEFFKNNYREQE